MPSVRSLLTMLLLGLMFAAGPRSLTARSIAAVATDSSKQDAAVTIFLDVPSEYVDYIKKEVTFVNFVRDRSDAEVQVLLTTRATGSGGAEQTLTLVGQYEWHGVNDTLSFYTYQSDSESSVRESIVHKLKLALVRYAEHSPLANEISVEHSSAGEQERVKDKWDYWVIGINSDWYLNGEKSQRFLWTSNYVTADRVTPSLRLRFSAGGSYNESSFDIGSATITSLTRSYYFESKAVKSINDHWSYGAYGTVWSSSFSNIDRAWEILPALEYNVFAYSQSTRRELRFLYRIGLSDVVYEEETIYYKTAEWLFREMLSIVYVIKEPWGSISATGKGSHYFHDARKNRLSLEFDISLRLFGGLSVALTGTVDMIHDLLSLPRMGATTEEILLQRRQLETQYQYYFSFGFRYSFGSIYSNVVNPRFGG